MACSSWTGRPRPVWLPGLQFHRHFDVLLPLLGHADCACAAFRQGTLVDQGTNSPGHISAVQRARGCYPLGIRQDCRATGQPPAFPSMASFPLSACGFSARYPSTILIPGQLAPCDSSRLLHWTSSAPGQPRIVTVNHTPQCTEVTFPKQQTAFRQTFWMPRAAAHIFLPSWRTRPSRSSSQSA